jgi:hypothetical protein
MPVKPPPPKQQTQGLTEQGTCQLPPDHPQLAQPIPNVNQAAPTATEIDPRYRHLTCYNCGEPGHFVGFCDKAKVCFICAVPGHYMTECPKWKESQPTATYFGSAGAGLGFFHIDLPKAETIRWLNISNCGVVVIKKGEISMSELEDELSAIFYNKWPWQIRELTLARFLVRFPPHRKVADIKSLPSFNLRKEGVQVEVKEWIGEIDHFRELSEV